MRLSFGRLVEQVAALSTEDQELPMGRLAERFGVTVERVADAIDALKMMLAAAEQACIALAPGETAGHRPEGQPVMAPQYWRQGPIMPRIDE